MMFLLSLIYIGCGKSCKIPSKYNFGFKKSLQKNFSNMSCNIIKILLYRFKNSTLHFYGNISKSSYMWWFNSLAAGYKVLIKKCSPKFCYPTVFVRCGKAFYITYRFIEQDSLPYLMVTTQQCKLFYHLCKSNFAVLVILSVFINPM